MTTRNIALVANDWTELTGLVASSNYLFSNASGCTVRVFMGAKKPITLENSIPFNIKEPFAFKTSTDNLYVHSLTNSELIVTKI